MLNVGILSSAKIAREHLIPAALAADDVNLQGIASRSAQTAQALASHFQIPKAYASYDELLADATIDAIYIPLPTSQHVEWAIRCADMGKHVLVEKPLALKAEDIEPVVEAAARNQVIVSEAFMVHYHPQWHKVRELIGDNRIGRLRQVQGSFSYYNRDPQNMRNQPALGGGALPDIGVYPIVTTRLVTGSEPVTVSGNVDFDDQFGTDTYASAEIDFADFNLSFYVSTNMALRQTMCFHGESGFIEMSAPFNAGGYDQARVTLCNQSHDETAIFTFSSVDQYRLQFEAFARAVKAGDDSELFSLASSIQNQRVIDAIYRSSREKTPVRLAAS
jgi:predicted dehydrogenase